MIEVEFDSAGDAALPPAGRAFVQGLRALVDDERHGSSYLFATENSALNRTARARPGPDATRTMVVIGVGVLGNVIQDVPYQLLEPRDDTGER